MSTFTNTAREVEMPNGDVVVIHNAPTGGANTTSNIKKFKYDDNGHVTESTAANATDLNLSGYSTPTTGTTAIGASDDVQTAIGKLDHQSQIDQSNILYVSEHNANRNLLLNTASTTTIDGVTFTVNADKSVTITGSQNNPSQHTKLVLGKFTANRSDLVLDSGIAASASANIFINTQDGVTTTRNLGHATITGTDLNTERDYQILVIAGTSNINTTIKPMICTQADWDATQEYEASGGLPNYDLTRLEAEDRAALAEVVDSGAKQKLNYSLASLQAANPSASGYDWNNNVCTVQNVRFTVNSDLTITVKQLGSHSTTAIFNICDYTAVSGDYLSGGYGTETAYFYTRGGGVSDKTGNGYEVESTQIGVSKTYAIAVSTTNTVTSDMVFKPMICTKAAFGVSKAFVPYRMPYSQALALLSTRAPSGIADYVASGSVNDLPSGCALCNPNVTGMPALADNYFIIRTRIYDANCAEQEAVAPAGNRRFNRTKWGGTWTSWEEYTLKS